MKYQVLARKWRPQQFSDLLGQNHVVRALSNALNRKRLHHAYLFTGTRGVGKTTIARIFARALNCLEQISAIPCDQCANCQAILKHQFIDILEVDAASKTKVEDTRELLENAQFMPSQGHYKIYIIDEVHMLSHHSFNALLKTLEEPPEHVKFLLATTEPQKLPLTILSRCLQFNLKQIDPETITQQLDRICQAESIPYQTDALQRLARAAEGSMRDALSLLDQAIAYSNHQITSTAIQDMLGIVAEDHIVYFLEQLAQHNARNIMKRIEELAELSNDFSMVLNELIMMLHQLALCQIIPETSNPSLHHLAKIISPQDIQLYYQIAVLGKKDIHLALDLKSGFEMILLRMIAFKPGKDDESTNIKSTIRTEKIPIPPPTPKVTTPQTVTQPHSQWREIIQSLNLKGMTLQLANHCHIDNLNDNEIILQIAEKYNQFRSNRLEEKLQQALQKYYNKPLKLKFLVQTPQKATPAQIAENIQQTLQQQAVHAIEQDPHVKNICTTFDAKINKESIRPIQKKEP